MVEIENDRAQGARPATSVEIDFALVIARLIDAVQQDPRQLRSSIYELARIKLYEQFAREDSREIRRLAEALETAIESVEAFSQRHENISQDPPALTHRASREFVSAAGISARPPQVPSRVQSERQASHRDATVTPILQVTAAPLTAKPLRAKDRSTPIRGLLVVGTIGAAAVLGIMFHQQLNLADFLLKRSSPESKAQVPQTDSRPVDNVGTASANLPKPPLLPKAFGIYAIANDQLFELDQLPGRAPDARVAVSAAITLPSNTKIPDGRVRFVVYRRDSPPNRAEVRVVARIASAMTFEPSGKPAISAAQDTWVMRNIAFSYRVAPRPENPDMYEITSERENFPLPPGRYALVLKDFAFDFTVSGEITDINQCLQRVQAVNGAFYAPCPKP